MSQDENHDKTHVKSLSNFFCIGTLMLFVSERPQFTCLEAVNDKVVPSGLQQMSQDENYDKTHVKNLSNFFCKGTLMLFVSERPQFTCLEAVNDKVVPSGLQQMSQDENYDKTHVKNLSNFFCKGTLMLFVSKRPQFTCLEAVNDK